MNSIAETEEKILVGLGGRWREMRHAKIFPICFFLDHTEVVLAPVILSARRFFNACLV